MSNFIQLSFDPVAGAIRCATWIDDYFGPHQYGVQFEHGGPVYRPDQVEVAAAGECIADLRSKLAAAEAECAASMDEIARERARAEAAEAREMQLRHALEQFDALYDMLDVEDAILGDGEYFYGSAKVGGITYGDVRQAHAALSQSPSDYRERVRREAFEEAAKVADDFEARWDAQWCAEHKGSSHLEGKSDGAGEIASAIRALGDSNANG